MLTYSILKHLLFIQTCLHWNPFQDKADVCRFSQHSFFQEHCGGARTALKTSQMVYFETIDAKVYIYRSFKNKFNPCIS